MSRAVIDAATLRRVLKHEKKILVELTEANWQAGRVTVTAGMMARLARVMLLESLLDGSIELADQGEADGRNGTAPR